jgi:hypothetical protein
MGAPENLLGHRADQHLLDFAAAMCAGHDQVDLMLNNELFLRSPPYSFVSGLCELRLGKLKWVRCDDMGKIDARVIAARECNGIIQATVGRFRKIGRDKDFRQRHAVPDAGDSLFVWLSSVRHNSLLKTPPRIPRSRIALILDKGTRGARTASDFLLETKRLAIEGFSL